MRRGGFAAGADAALGAELTDPAIAMAALCRHAAGLQATGGWLQYYIQPLCYRDVQAALAAMSLGRSPKFLQILHSTASASAE